jgi:hypothetical protein
LLWSRISAIFFRLGRKKNWLFCFAANFIIKFIAQLFVKIAIFRNWFGENLATSRYRKKSLTGTWDRCYDHNFLRFLTIFGEKIGVFLKNQCYDQIFKKLALFSVKNANFLTNFSAKIFKKSYHRSLPTCDAKTFWIDRFLNFAASVRVTLFPRLQKFIKQEKNNLFFLDHL